MNRLSRFAMMIALAGGVGLAGLTLTTGPAQADPDWGPSYSGANCPPMVGSCTHWCPGDPLMPGGQVVSWDWNICHDWYWNSEGIVDIASRTIYPWHGGPHAAEPLSQPGWYRR